MKQAYEKRLKRLTDECSKLRLEYLHPQGAFYLFIKLGVDDDKDFCYRLLNEYYTCAVPGSAFGQTGKGYLRLSYAVDMNDSLKGLAQITKCLQNTVE
jgi:aminotransferase